MLRCPECGVNSIASRMEAVRMRIRAAAWRVRSSDLPVGPRIGDHAESAPADGRNASSHLPTTRRCAIGPLTRSQDVEGPSLEQNACHDQRKHPSTSPGWRARLLPSGPSPVPRMLPQCPDHASRPAQRTAAQASFGGGMYAASGARVRGHPAEPTTSARGGSKPCSPAKTIRPGAGATGASLRARQAKAGNGGRRLAPPFTVRVQDG